MITTMALPGANPGRPTISWIAAAISGVRWSGPASLTLVHSGTLFQATLAEVVVLDVISAEAVENAVALSAAWALIVSEQGLRYVRQRC